MKLIFSSISIQNFSYQTDNRIQTNVFLKFEDVL